MFDIGSCFGKCLNDFKLFAHWYCPTIGLLIFKTKTTIPERLVIWIRVATEVDPVHLGLKVNCLRLMPPPAR